MRLKIAGKSVNIHYAWFIVPLLLGYFLFRIIHYDSNWYDYSENVLLMNSKLLAEGELIYHDFMADYPPVLFLIETIFFKVMNDPSQIIFYTRIFAIIIHMSISLLCFRIAYKLFGGKVAILSMLVYLTIPLGWQWHRYFETDNLMTFFLILSILMMLNFSDSKIKIYLSGIFMALAVLTKYICLPCAFIVPLIIIPYRWNDVKKFMLMFLSVIFIVVVFFEVTSKGKFLDDMWLLMSIPKFNLEIFRTKLHALYNLDGFYIFLALIGAIYAFNMTSASVKIMITLLLATIFISILACFRDSTGILVFTMAEPVIAIFAAYALILIHKIAFQQERNVTDIWVKLIRIGLIIFFTGFTIYIIGIKGIAGNIMGDMAGEVPYCMEYINYDKNELIPSVIKQIEETTNPEDTILVCNYLHILSQRKSPCDITDNYAWRMLYQKGNRNAINKVTIISDHLQKQKIKFVSSNIFFFTGLNDEELIKKALNENYSNFDMGEWSYWLPKK